MHNFDKAHDEKMFEPKKSQLLSEGIFTSCPQDIELHITFVLVLFHQKIKKKYSNVYFSCFSLKKLGLKLCSFASRCIKMILRIHKKKSIQSHTDTYTGNTLYIMYVHEHTFNAHSQITRINKPSMKRRDRDDSWKILFSGE